MQRKRILILAVASLVALLGSAGVFSELYLQSQNSLLQNGRWISTKQRMQLHLVGALDFIESRQALAGNRLNLGSWSGFNEVLLNRAVEVRSLSLRLRLAKNAHASVIFGRSPSGYSGVRFSRHPAFESQFFVASPEGEFFERQALDVGDLGEAWRRIDLTLADSRAVVSVDGEEVANFASQRAGPEIVGFRAGLAPVSIDDVRIELVSGESIHESFRHSRAGGRSLLVFIGLLGAFAIGIAGIVSSRSGPARGTVAAFSFVSVNALLAVIGGALLAVDYFYWSSAYFYKTPGIRLVNAQALPLAVEKFRRDLFETRLPNLIGDRRSARLSPIVFVDDSIVKRGRPERGPSDEYSFFSSQTADRASFVPFDALARLPRKRSSAFRVAFMGSSQTWGAGAESSHETFVAACHRLVAAALPGVAIETVNLSINGSTSHTQRPLFEQLAAYVEADLLVLNFANNDARVDGLVRNLRGILQTNQALGAAALILLEANSLEASRAQALAAKHTALRALAAELDVPVLDLHGFANSAELRDSGFLWWDYVHFSSFGHRRVAEWLAPRVAEQVRSQLVTRSASAESAR